MESVVLIWLGCEEISFLMLAPLHKGLTPVLCLGSHGLVIIGEVIHIGVLVVPIEVLGSILHVSLIVVDGGCTCSFLEARCLYRLLVRLHIPGKSISVISILPWCISSLIVVCWSPWGSRLEAIVELLGVLAFGAVVLGVVWGLDA